MSNIIDLAEYRDITPKQDEIRLPEDGFVHCGIALSGADASPSDLVEAHTWFSLAAIRGHQKARGHRLRVSQRLDGQQIQCSQVRVQEFARNRG